MKKMGRLEAKNKLSEVCAQVASTLEPLVVTRHGKPLGKIIPYSAPGSAESVWDTVAGGRAKYGKLTDDVELPQRDPRTNRPDPLSRTGFSSFLSTNKSPIHLAI